jgi:hypothetical protein
MKKMTNTMTKEEIRAHLESGRKIHWNSDIYEVRADGREGSLIVWCIANGSCGGLLHLSDLRACFLGDSSSTKAGLKPLIQL